ncbi:VOC family protein [Bogoriella caseilytica]|uniref:Putative enzyme related to lactoylglutathione lyase n=1 Tax=Bogoriella caseilytica TaxID=56055 RepID=A0A3N2BA84_9MICO|nr:VOC family protein [Bogoriella caseilytica]ROR72190.1 putative enzyme related to lactoylglutathione lyase [Bogoriella caseilytica]
MIRSVVWWEVETDAPERFQQFHADLSGWTFRPAFGGTELQADYWVIQAGGSDVGGLQRGAIARSSGTRVYLHTDDLEAALARVRDLAGEVERERVELDGTQWFALFRDSAGVQWGLWTDRP